MSDDEPTTALVPVDDEQPKPLPRPDWDQVRVPLVLTSPIEESIEHFMGLALLLVLAGVFGLPFFSGYGLFWSAVPCILAYLLGRAVFSGSYFLDRGSETVLYQRRIGPLVREETMAALDDVAVVTVRGQSEQVTPEDGEPYRKWSYRLLVMLEDGTSIPVSDETPDLTDANDLAGELARELGAPLVPGRAEQVLEQVPEAKLPEVIRTQTQAGAEAERLVGYGLFVGAMSYVLSLPGLAYPGTWTWQAAQALLAGTGGLAAVAGYATLTVATLVMGLPSAVACVGLLRQASHRPSTEEKSKEIEDEGFEAGLELWLFLILANGMAGSVAWVAGGLSWVAPTTQLASLVLMNLAIWFSWAFTGLRLPQESSPGLPDAVRVLLAGRLEHREARCGYCGVTIVPEDVMACNTCEALHHHECWDEFGRCTTFGCGSSAASPILL